MPRKNSRRDAAAEKMAGLLIEHMEETMTPAEANATLRDLKAFSQAPRRASHRGKPSRSAKNADSRPLSRARAQESHKLAFVF
jgi:hypothetical protein